jgi:hypothetical protein
MQRKINRYRFPNGARLATGPTPSVVPAWAPTQVSVPVSRKEAAEALRNARKAVRRLA